MTRSLPIFSFHALFTWLLFFVVALSIVAPRAASFAAPVAGLILSIAWFCQHRNILLPRPAEIAFILGIPALAGISALWAIDPPFAVERALKLLPMLIFGFIFIAAARQAGAEGFSTRTVRHLFILYIVGALGIALEIFWGLKIYRFLNDVPPEHAVSIVLMNRSMVVLAALYCPLMLLLHTASMNARGKWILGGGATLALVAGLVQTESQSAQIFFILTILFVFLFPVRMRAAWIITAIIVCAAAFAAPWLAIWMFTHFTVDAEAASEGILRAASIPHRLEVWNFVATEILKHPWIGQGIEAIRYIKSEHWLVLPNANNMLHPHNAPLQLWVEFGVIGITTGCALFLYTLKRLWNAPVAGRRAGLAACISMLVVMSTGYGLWQSWQIGLLLVLSGLMAAAIATIRPENS